MVDKEKIWILDGASRQPVEGILHRSFDMKTMPKVGASWQVQLAALKVRAIAANVPNYILPEHAHWTWANKGKHYPQYCRRLAIECQGEIQGMMVVAVGDPSHVSRLREHKNQKTVYVDFVMVSPWNWSEFLTPLGENTRYKSVGRALITAAVDLSRDEGYNGIVALHALPQAERFYGDTCRMVTMGPDRNYQDLRYFEMTEEIANHFTEVKK